MRKSIEAKAGNWKKNEKINFRQIRGLCSGYNVYRDREIHAGKAAGKREHACRKRDTFSIKEQAQ